MSSAKTLNFDYAIEDGVLEMISGTSEELNGQLFELSTNEGEWFLGPSFGMPWIQKDSKGNNVGILGTVFNSGYTTAVISKKLRRSGYVKNIDSIAVQFSNGLLTGSVNETLFTNEELINFENVSLTFSFGGDL